MCSPVAPGRLRVRAQPELVQHLTDDESDLTHERPLAVGRRVEVDQQVVRVLDLRHARVPRVQLDATEVGDPGEAGGVVEHREHGRVTARELDEDLVDVVRVVLRDSLLVEELARDAVGEALHVERPPPDVGECERRDVDVVGDEVELRQTRLGEEDLLGARDRNVVPADLAWSEYRGVRARRASIDRRDARAARRSHRGRDARRIRAAERPDRARRTRRRSAGPGSSRPSALTSRRSSRATRFSSRATPASRCDSHARRTACAC